MTQMAKARFQQDLCTSQRLAARGASWPWGKGELNEVLGGVVGRQSKQRSSQQLGAAGRSWDDSCTSNTVASTWKRLPRNTLLPVLSDPGCRSCCSTTLPRTSGLSMEQLVEVLWAAAPHVPSPEQLISAFPQANTP